MILVVGPKDLPGMLRNFGKAMRGMRRMAGDFQRQFDDALRDAELDEVKNLSSSKVFSPIEEARKSINSVQKQVTDTLNEPAEADVSPPKPVAEAPSKAAASKPAKTTAVPAKAKKVQNAKPAAKKPATTRKTTTKPKAAAKTAKAKPAAKNKASNAITGTDA